MSDFTMTIGGQAVHSDRTFRVENPATEEELARAPLCSAAQLDEAMNAAARAFAAWRRDEDARRTALKEGAVRVAAAADAIAALLTAEQGKPLAEARREVQRAVMWLEYFADLPIAHQLVTDDENARAEVVARPLGVVAAITPWNFPVSLAAWKLAPALLAGNTVVLKPSPYTPLATLRLGAVLNEVLPAGVLNVVSGDDELGKLMTMHPTPRKISFTGSVGTGKLVAAAAAPDLKRVTLELGGNDPAIILDDADPAEIAQRLFWAAFSNNGQVCTAIKRVYVPERMYSDLVEAVAEVARNVSVGDGSDSGTQLGPVNNLPQYQRIESLVDDAVSRGAVAVAGGARRVGAGYFFQPTILSHVADEAGIVSEEQFGPALPIMAYSDLDDALRRANATHFGLSASVWSADPERAAAVGAEIECGTVWINSHLIIMPYLPFGGAKWSGLGVENGPWGLAEYTQPRVIYTTK
jgi:acyl-CoA reductase-like NAD-dependent aldehyde dehydrogenase